ncbi:unnamed protein product [Ectocarpus sp. CCAP 1310/34]|nr:unnamed protein product [Ectocarpus sp. CCAP 1310/34]
MLVPGNISRAYDPVSPGSPYSRASVHGQHAERAEICLIVFYRRSAHIKPVMSSGVFRGIFWGKDFLREGAADFER